MLHGPISLMACVFEFLISVSLSSEAAVETGHNVLYACQQYAELHPTINCFWKTLQGKVTEASCVQLDRFSKDATAILEILDAFSTSSGKAKSSKTILPIYGCFSADGGLVNTIAGMSATILTKPEP